MFGYYLDYYEHFQIPVFLTHNKIRETQYVQNSLMVVLIAHRGGHAPGKPPECSPRPTPEQTLCYVNSSHKNLSSYKSKSVGVYVLVYWLSTPL